jgi:hypothetical protein
MISPTTLSPQLPPQVSSSNSTSAPFSFNPAVMNPPSTFQPVSVIGPAPPQGGGYNWKVLTALYVAVAALVFLAIRRLFFKKK